MSAIIKDGGPAYPVPNLEHDPDFNGMSLRDYFAGQYIAGAFGGIPGQHLQPDNAASEAYKIADAMIAASNTTDNGGAA